MKIKEFTADERSYLKMTDLENFFNVYLDKNGNYVYNLNASIYFQIDSSQLADYVLQHDAHWTLISYKIYGTTRLAWLLMKLNHVDAVNVFDKKHASDIIKYIPKNQIEALISSLGDSD